MYFERFKALGIKPNEILDYLRKSQSDDPLLTVEEVLAKHESLLDEWAEKNIGGKVPEENKFREVVSGETLRDRPEINKVLRLVESPKYKAVKVVEPQRLSRGDLEDMGRLIKLLRHTNTLVITPTMIYDLRDEYDRDIFERELKRGNEYLEYYKKIQSRGKLLSVSQGNYIGSVPPYGYDKIKVIDGKKECPTLKPNKEQADVVRLIFDLYVNKNMGRHSIAVYLDELGIKPIHRATWASTTIKMILTNVHYIGKVRWNWRKAITVVEDSEFVKKRPFTVDEYLEFDGKHEPIVSEELFYAAQEKLGKGPRIRTNAIPRNPFAGVVYCRCGRGMVLQNLKNETPRLICPEQHRCKTRSSAIDIIVDRISEILEQCIEDFERRIENNESDSVKLHASLIATLEKKLKDLEAKEISQWEMQSDPDVEKRMPQHIFQQLNEKILKEKEEVREALCKAYESMPEPVDYKEKVTTFTDALKALQDPDEDVLKKNALLKACIERIDYSRERGVRAKGASGINGWTYTPIELNVKLKG